MERIAEYLIFFLIAGEICIVLGCAWAVMKSRQQFKMIKYMNLTAVAIALVLVGRYALSEDIPGYVYLLLVIIGSLLPGYSMYERKLPGADLPAANKVTRN